MIKLICTNDECKYSYEVSEKELENNPQYHKKCLICGSQLKVSTENLEKIIEKDLETQIKSYIDLWFRKLGIEYTIEMVERHKNTAIYRLYKAELEKRGFKVK